MRLISKNKRIFITATALLTLTAALIVYSRFDPESSYLFPRCLFLTLTGLECPGCGSQRAVHQLLNGNVGAAFRYNALLASPFPTSFYGLYCAHSPRNLH